MNFFIFLFKSSPGYQIIYPLSMLSGLINLITLPLVAFFIALLFDPQFKDRTVYLYVLGSSRMMRSALYAGFMLMPQWLRIRPHTLPKAIFKGYNLWKNATIFERILAYVYILSGTILMLAIIIYFSHRFIFDFLLH